MEIRYNVWLAVKNLSEERYDMLFNFLEETGIDYQIEDESDYEVDTRSEQQKYDDWLQEQADLHNDEVKMYIV